MTDVSASGGAASAARPEGASKSDLVSWLRSQLDTDERIAIAASTDDDGSTPGGEHWHWECSNCDTPIPITPVTLLAEFLECPNCSSYGVALRSVEQYPTRSVGMLPHFVTRYNEEQRPVDALHIQIHEPAHVLRTVAAHRAILARHAPDEAWIPSGCHACSQSEWGVDWPCADVLSIAEIYQDRPGWDPSWKVET